MLGTPYLIVCTDVLGGVHVLNLTSLDKPDFAAYEEEIGADGNFILIDPVRYEQKLNELEPYRDTAQLAVKDQLGIMSNSYYQKPTASRLRDTLLEFGGVDREDLSKYNAATHSRELSVDAKKVVAPLVDKLAEKDKTKGLTYTETMDLKLLRAWQEYATLNSAVNTATSKWKMFRDVEEKGYTGTPLLAIDFRYDRAETSRYYTSGDNIQGWNKQFLPSITVPEGYFLWWGDMSQIDLRVALNCIIREDPHSAKNDPEIARKMQEFNTIIDSCTDKYEAFARLLHSELDRPFDLEKFKRDRPKYKEGILARIYNTGINTLTASFGGDREFAELLDTYFKSNRRYQQFVDTADRLIHMNCNVQVRDYFDVERVVETDTKYYDTVLSQILNAPIQITSNSIVMLWIQKTIQRFRDLGFGPDKIRTYMIRHDEAVFMVHLSLLPYMWILEDHSKIALDDWDLLEMGRSVGIYYSEPDPMLTEQYEKVISLNKDKIQPRTVFAPRAKPYHPVSNVVEVYMFNASDPIEFCEKMGLPVLPHQSPSEHEESMRDARRQIIGIANGSIEAARVVRTAVVRYKEFFGKCVYRLSTSKVWQCCDSLGELYAWAHRQDANVLIIRNAAKVGFEYTTENFLIQYKVMALPLVMNAVTTFYDDHGKRRPEPDYSKGSLQDPLELERAQPKKNEGGWASRGRRRDNSHLDVSADDLDSDEIARFQSAGAPTRQRNKRFD